jgi:DNA (cytosine-5)-methyltransferase 1
MQQTSETCAHGRGIQDQMGRAEVKPTFGSLFAGVGGFDMGMEQAGWECKFQVEWDKHCRSVLDRHWSDVEKWSDIRNVNGRFLPPVDCIIFGSPCQDLSVGGKRAGLEGERSGLFHEAMRIIKEMRDATGGVFPRYSIWENVKGALSSNKGRDFGTALNAMVECGAVQLEWGVLDAKWFGVPQRRKRIFVIGIYDPAAARKSGSEILSVARNVQWDSAQGEQARKETATDTPRSFIKVVRSGKRLDDGSLPAEVWREAETVPTLTQFESSEAFAHTILFHNSYRDGVRLLGEQSMTLSAIMGTGGGNTPMLANAEVVRRLTPLECERLMGFPDDHTRWTAEGKEQTDGHRYKQCGNAVVTPVAKWVGGQLMDVHTAAYPVTPLV